MFLRGQILFQIILPFGSAFQTLLKFKLQALLLSALTLTQILSLQLNFNLRHCTTQPHEKVLKAENILQLTPSPGSSSTIPLLLKL